MNNGRVPWRSLAAALFALMLAADAFGRVGQISLPDLDDGPLLQDIFRTAEAMRDRFRSVEFKEQLSFRLAGVVRDGTANRAVDLRQSADYSITVKPGQPPERKFIQASHVPQFELKNLLKNVDVAAIQETLPQLITVQTALLGFVGKDYVSGYKEIGKEKINKHRALKLALRFRPGRFPVEECILWVDEQTHAPLKASVKIGDIGRFGDVRLLVFYDGDGSNSLPAAIHQELGCVTYGGGSLFRLEQNSVYSDFKPLPLE